MKVKVGTRGSKLAIAQTQIVLEKIKTTFPSIEPKIEIIKTSGDTKRETTKAGTFVNEINNAVLLGSIDIGIHSLKDLPTELPDGLSLPCIPERVSPNDALVSRDGSGIFDLPEGSIVGVSAPRRLAEIRHIRRDLILKDIRGNVDTRIRKMEEGQYDAIVTALAALERLDLQGVASQIFGIKEVVPAAGQGALAVVCREGHDLVNKLTEINDVRAYNETTCERSFLEKLNSDCKFAAGAVARVCETKINLISVIHDGGRVFLELSGKDPVTTGQKAASILVR